MNARFLAAASSLVLLTGSPAGAIDRIQTTGRTCSQIQSTVKTNRSVILVYGGGSGGALYDRAVADSSLCLGVGYGYRTSVPAKDTSACPVIFCRSGGLRP
jgi:hypothetical protein